MRKFDIVNALIAKNRYTKYLEICTPSTGLRFSRVDESVLCWRHRLLYRCPAGYRDGAEITFRSEGDEISHLLDQAMAYDLIFVDPYHTFECSMRDLQTALKMLRPGGTIVVHDCSPKDKQLCSASFRAGSWFGVTYCAYIEFALSDPSLVHYTVDSDCGCGVIKKLPRATATATATMTEKDRRSNEFARLWFNERGRQRDIFDFFCQHRRELLNLISVKDFLERENIVLPRFWQWRESLATILQI